MSHNRSQRFVMLYLYYTHPVPFVKRFARY